MARFPMSAVMDAVAAAIDSAPAAADFVAGLWAD
jgi:hypothetical protein